MAPACYISKVQFAEPFSALGNLCSWAAGVGLYVLPFLSFERLPAQAFGAGMLLVLLGGCSGAFHADGSRPGTWQHATDRIMMYALVMYLGVVSFGGLWQAFRGHSASPRSWVGLTVNLLAPFAVVVVVLYQEEIDTKLLYLVIYPIILLTNGMIAALLAAAVWLTVASRFGWPVSTTHSIVGSIVGFACVSAGVSAVAWDKVGQIVASWVTSPLLSGVTAFAMFSLLRRNIIAVENFEEVILVTFNFPFWNIKWLILFL